MNRWFLKMCSTNPKSWLKERESDGNLRIICPVTRFFFRFGDFFRTGDERRQNILEMRPALRVTWDADATGTGGPAEEVRNQLTWGKHPSSKNIFW